MMRLVAPNGAAVEAAEGAVERLLAAGFRRPAAEAAEKKPQASAPARAARGKRAAKGKE